MRIMKFFTEKQLLKHAISLPLTEIKTDDIERTLNVKQVPLAKVKNRSGYCVNHLTSCTTPVIFRKPDSPHTISRAPIRNRHKLINLSFSQPSSPKTPSLKTPKTTLVCATPFLKSGSSKEVNNDCFIPPTPMIINPIEVLNCMTANVDALGMIPDILEIIDDETDQVETLDRQLKLLSDVELNDDTVADYLLDLTLEVQPQQTQLPKPQDNHPERGKVRKKNRFTKLLSEEEREALKRLQKEKSRQKRKQRFREPPVAGTRRSKRIRQPVRAYTPTRMYP